MIEPIRQSAGAPRAKAICDECGGEETVACGYTRRSPNKPPEPIVSQVRAKAISAGWSYIKGKLRCAECEKKRKVVPMKKPDIVKAPEAPTKRQRINIITMLADVYDIDAGRYSRGDTDDSIADVLGLRPGWVAEIREAEFGPDGSNDEMAEVLEAFTSASKAFEDLRKNTSDLEKQVAAAITEMRAQKDRVDSAVSRMHAITGALSSRIKAKAGI